MNSMHGRIEKLLGESHKVGEPAHLSEFKGEAKKQLN